MSEEIKKTRSKKYEIETKEVKKPIVKEEIEESETKERSKLIKFFLIIGLIFILFCTYSFVIEPSLLEVKEYKISSNKLPDSFDGLKIIQLSDIHYGTSINQKQLNHIVTKINELNPDIIFFTGDLIDKNIVATEDIQNEIIESLKALNATYKYAILGNEDDSETFTKIMNELNFQILSNQTTLLYYKDKTPIAITGLNNISSNPNYEEINKSIDNIDITSIYHIVLFHESNAIDNVINLNPDLILTSGTLGGKINLVKPLFLPDTANKYYEEYTKINNTDIYVSSGLGTSGINIRFNNLPSFNLYRIYKEEN